MTKLKLNYDFKFTPFSRRQLQVLTWWLPKSPYHTKEAIVCDGSVRAGKTVVMSLSYVLWSMTLFQGQQFILTGKTIGSLRRNVVRPLLQMLRSEGFLIKDRRSENYLEISKNGVTNYYFLFGGKDESSQDLVQGLTAAGAFFDEVVLMPESFVNQATARCSVDGAKLWFNGNPEGPFHWFKMEWIDKLTHHNAIRIHFMMKDNPSLTDEVIQRYERSYTGVFYSRYILGQWVAADGLVYSNFDKDIMVADLPDDATFSQSYVAVDYGTMNPTVFKLWRKHKDTWYNTDEYYHSGRETAKQKTDAEYAADLEEFYVTNNMDKKTDKVILDPSAKSFRTQLKKLGFLIIQAKNDVLDGIRDQMTAMNEGLVKWTSKAVHTFKELNSYIWDKKASDKGEDKVVKEHDHCCDADRYFIHTIIMRKKSGFVPWK